MKKVVKAKVPVSIPALLARINRKLRHNGRHGEWLYKARGYGPHKDIYPHDLGGYYKVDLDSNFVVQSHIDPEEYGREIGALAKWEALDDETKASRAKKGR